MSTKKKYQNTLRNRVCAVIISNNWVLLAKHNAPTRKKSIWMPPGGGVQFGESIQSALIREVEEETGLIVEPVRLLWVHEFIEKPFHAIEYYYECSVAGGALKLGKDPEHSKDDQILLDLQFIPFNEIEKLDMYPLFLKQCLNEGNALPKKIQHVISEKE